jgi:hypothetical protein
MPSLTDLLAGNVMGEADYLSQDPFFTAGRGISQIQTGAPRNNAEAFLLPLLQNTAAGALAGYGRGQANQQSFLDTQARFAPQIEMEKMLAGQEGYTPNPFLAPLLSEEMPEGFTMKQAAQMNLMSMLQQQQQLETAAKKQELINEALVKSSPEFLAAERLSAEAKAGGTLAGQSGGLALPPGMTPGDIVGEVQKTSNLGKSLEYVDSVVATERQRPARLVNISDFQMQRNKLSMLSARQ